MELVRDNKHKQKPSRVADSSKVVLGSEAQTPGTITKKRYTRVSLEPKEDSLYPKLHLKDLYRQCLSYTVDPSQNTKNRIIAKIGAVRSSFEVEREILTASKVTCMAYHSPFLYVGCEDPKIEIFKISEDQIIFKGSFGLDGVHCGTKIIEISRDGEYMFTVSKNEEINFLVSGGKRSGIFKPGGVQDLNSLITDVDYHVEGVRWCQELKKLFLQIDASLVILDLNTKNLEFSVTQKLPRSNQIASFDVYASQIDQKSFLVTSHEKIRKSQKSPLLTVWELEDNPFSDPKQAGSKRNDENEVLNQKQGFGAQRSGSTDILKETGLEYDVVDKSKSFYQSVACLQVYSSFKDKKVIQVILDKKAGKTLTTVNSEGIVVVWERSDPDSLEFRRKSVIGESLPNLGNSRKLGNLGIFGASFVSKTAKYFSTVTRDTLKVFSWREENDQNSEFWEVVGCFKGHYRPLSTFLEASSKLYLATADENCSIKLRSINSILRQNQQKMEEIDSREPRDSRIGANGAPGTSETHWMPVIQAKLREYFRQIHLSKNGELLVCGSQLSRGYSSTTYLTKIYRFLGKSKSFEFVANFELKGLNYDSKVIGRHAVIAVAQQDGVSFIESQDLTQNDKFGVVAKNRLKLDSGVKELRFVGEGLDLATLEVGSAEIKLWGLNPGTKFEYQISQILRVQEAGIGAKDARIAGFSFASDDCVLMARFQSKKNDSKCKLKFWIRDTPKSLKTVSNDAKSHPSGYNRLGRDEEGGSGGGGNYFKKVDFLDENEAQGTSFSSYLSQCSRLLFTIDPESSLNMFSRKNPKISKFTKIAKSTQKIISGPTTATPRQLEDELRQTKIELIPKKGEKGILVTYGPQRTETKIWSFTDTQLSLFHTLAPIKHLLTSPTHPYLILLEYNQQNQLKLVQTDSELRIAHTFEAYKHFGRLFSSRDEDIEKQRLGSAYGRNGGSGGGEGVNLRRRLMRRQALVDLVGFFIQDQLSDEGRRFFSKKWELSLKQKLSLSEGSGGGNGVRGAHITPGNSSMPSLGLQNALKSVNPNRAYPASKRIRDDRVIHSEWNLLSLALVSGFDDVFSAVLATFGHRPLFDYSMKKPFSCLKLAITADNPSINEVLGHYFSQKSQKIELNQSLDLSLFRLILGCSDNKLKHMAIDRAFQDPANTFSAQNQLKRLPLKKDQILAFECNSGQLTTDQVDRAKQKGGGGGRKAGNGPPVESSEVEYMLFNYRFSPSIGSDSCKILVQCMEQVPVHFNLAKFRPIFEHIWCINKMAIFWLSLIRIVPLLTFIVYIGLFGAEKWLGGLSLGLLVPWLIFEILGWFSLKFAFGAIFLDLSNLASFYLVISTPLLVILRLADSIDMNVQNDNFWANLTILIAGFACLTQFQALKPFRELSILIKQVFSQVVPLAIFSLFLIFLLAVTYFNLIQTTYNNTPFDFNMYTYFAQQYFNILTGEWSGLGVGPTPSQLLNYLVSSLVLGILVVNLILAVMTSRLVGLRASPVEITQEDLKIRREMILRLSVIVRCLKRCVGLDCDDFGSKKIFCFVMRRDDLTSLKYSEGVSNRSQIDLIRRIVDEGLKRAGEDFLRIADERVLEATGGRNGGGEAPGGASLEQIEGRVKSLEDKLERKFERIEKLISGLSGAQ